MKKQITESILIRNKEKLSLFVENMIMFIENPNSKKLENKRI